MCDVEHRTELAYDPFSCPSASPFHFLLGKRPVNDKRSGLEYHRCEEGNNPRKYQDNPSPDDQSAHSLQVDYRKCPDNRHESCYHRQNPHAEWMRKWHSEAIHKDWRVRQSHTFYYICIPLPACGGISC